MNRAQRRLHARHAPASIRAFAAAYRCPDCLSETTRPVQDRGIWRIEVRHDDTCPTWRAMQRRGAR